SSSKNYTFSGDGKISSGASLVKSGAGTLTIANAGNDFTGTVTITGGTLTVGNPTALGSTLGKTNVDGGALNLGGQDVGREPIEVTTNGGAIVNEGSETTLYDVTLAGPATFGGTESWTVSGLVPQNGWQAGQLVGGGQTLTKTGANQVTLSDLGSTGLGNINVNEGTLTVSGSTNLGSSAINLSGGATLRLIDLVDPIAKTLNVAADGGTVYSDSGDNVIDGNGGTLTGTLYMLTDADATMTLANALDGAGGLTLQDQGRLILSGENTYTGPTDVSIGTLELVTGGQIDTDSLITNHSAIEVTSGAHTVGVIAGSGTTTVVGGASLTATSITQGTLTIGSVTPASGAAAAPVPEPGTWLLLLVGLLGVAGRRTLRSRR
ncbi:MAG: autotransporter-associated beta strand repeat-containing protein, partial [Pirellulales bacterium]|nr:autotransporter-associated beta strand repeat-containing protein [Pirellulales bacterium]